MFRDKVYLKTLVKVALPITVQYFILNGLNAIDVMMIGQLGDVPVAGVGLANEIFFLLSLMVFGIGSGGAIFAAQYWGKRDLPNLHKVLGISLVIGVLGGSFFSVVALFFGEQALSLYTNDQEVIALGSQYLSLVGFIYVPWTITYVYASILRSAERVRLPMLVSILALGVNTLLNYALILGHFGFPALGVKGASIATVIARLLECGGLLFFTYFRKTPAAATLREMFAFDMSFLKKFLKTSLPVIFNEMLWSLGMTTYTAVYAHIGTDAIAAVNIAHTIESLAFVFFMGIGNGCAIIVGNKIGAGEDQTAFRYGTNSIWITILIAIGLGLVLVAASGAILSLYNISELSRVYARTIIMIAGLILWLRASNMTVFIGLLRAGGDTRYALFTEMFSMWGIGVPLAFLGGFVLHLPVYWVYLMVITDELIKFIIGMRRVFTRRWINNLVQSQAAPAPLEALAGE